MQRRGRGWAAPGAPAGRLRLAGAARRGSSSMPADARRGRAHPLRLERSVRLLACDFFLIADCQELVNVLDRLVQHAGQTYPVARQHRFEARRRDDGYRVYEDGRELDAPADARSAAELLFWRMQELALAALSEFT